MLLKFPKFIKRQIYLYSNAKSPRGVHEGDAKAMPALLGANGALVPDNDDWPMLAPVQTPAAPTFAPVLTPTRRSLTRRTHPTTTITVGPSKLVQLAPRSSPTLL